MRSQFTASLIAACLCSVASAQVNQFVGPSPNSSIVLDFDSPFVGSGPISPTDAAFTSVGIVSVNLIGGTFSANGDTLTATSNVMGQGLISQNSVLTVGGVGEPLDGTGSMGGWEIVLAAPVTEFQVLFIDQVNMQYEIELLLGANSIGMDTFVYSGGFPNPPHYWTGTGVFDTIRLVFPQNVGVGLDEFALPGPPGTNYCMANANSTGVPASMSASGTVSVGANDLTLEVNEMPANSFGFFLTSLTPGFVPNPGGSAGNLCVGGQIGRYVGPGQIQNSGSAGAISLLIDNTMQPSPIGFVAVIAGETWRFTSWFRDSDGMGGATSNFADGLEITFQ